uniref:Cyclic nucleotide-binding domain-containing protein n=1 Tax=Meloidogyne hapla TaxID=6305 RepID=A0A1I8BAU1_MELHA
MFIVKYGRLEMPVDDEFPDEQSFYISTERESPPLHFLHAIGDFQNRILQEGDIFGDWALVSESKIPYTVRSVGYSLLCILEREAMAVAFDEYPHSRRMVRRKGLFKIFFKYQMFKAKLICQQYEQRWKRKDSLSSFDSAAGNLIKIFNYLKEFNISSSQTTK